MTPITRRDFTRIIAFAAGAAATPASAYAVLRQDGQSQVFDWSPLAGGAALLCEGQGGNAVVVPSAGESLLIDCKNAGFGHALRAGAEREGAPLRWVVNTHHHADHTGGNDAFTGALPVIAHRAAEPRILTQHQRYVQTIAAVSERIVGAGDERAEMMIDAAPPNYFTAGYAMLEASDWGPTLLMDDEREIRWGDAVAELRHIGAGHTDNDVFIHFPAENILHTGDLCFHDLHPFIDRPAGATTEGWIRSCKAMLEVVNDDTVVVPGHGAVGGPEVIRKQIDYFEKTTDAVQSAIDDGLDRGAVTNLSPEHFKGLGFEQLKQRVLGAVYDELTGAPPA